MRAFARLRAAFGRLACRLGVAHRPVGWYVFVRPSHPRYEWRVECLWCLRRLA